MKNLAKAILLAVEYKEESFDKEAAKHAIDSGRLVDFSRFYTKSIYSATVQAVEHLELESSACQLIYILLRNSWNEAIDWAEEILKK